MQLLDMIINASKGMGEVSMPERKDIATAKDQRDCDKMGIRKLIQKRKDSEQNQGQNQQGPCGREVKILRFL